MSKSHRRKKRREHRGGAAQTDASARATEDAREGRGRPADAPRVRTHARNEALFAGGFTALCALLALVFFREFVLQPGTMPFGTDMLGEAYPLRKLAVDEIRAGRDFPLWNPFAYSGIPFLETLPYPVFYPTSLLYFVMPLGRAIGWAFVLHFALAGVLMYVFVRRLGVSTRGAALGGLAFMLNGYLVSHLYAGQDGRMFAMSLMPLVFTFLHAGLESRRIGAFLLMGGAVALQVFTPHVQVMYFSSLAALAWFLTRAAGVWRAEGWGPAWGLAWRFGLGFALAAGVAAVQLWPTLTFLQWAVRGVETGYAYASSWALPPREITAFLAPDLIGTLDTYRGANPFKLHTEYAGAVPLALALAALVWGERRHTLFWALLALGALLFALGAATPVHRLAYHVLPMVKSLRAPALMTSVAAFAIAVLAGIGFDAAAARAGGAIRERRALIFWVATGLVLLAGLAAVIAPAVFGPLAGAGPPGSRPGPPAPFAASFAITVLAWIAAAGILRALGRRRLGSTVAAALIGAVLVADLWRVDVRFLEVVRPDEVLAPLPGVAHLQSLEPPFRVLGLPGSMDPNATVTHRLDGVWGLQKFRLAWYDRLMGGSTMENVGRIPLWRVLNLRYLTSSGPIEARDLELVDAGPPHVYRWTGDAPRAWVAPDARVVTDDAALELLSDPAFDPRVVALLAEPLAGAGAAGTASAEGTTPATNSTRPGGVSSGDTAAGVRYLTYEPNRIEAEVVTPAPGYAVFSEAYHPYWEAAVDGAAVPVARADLAFRAVVVPAGTHRVSMQYRPHAFERARFVSGAVLAAALAFAFASAGRARRNGRLPGRGA